MILVNAVLSRRRSLAVALLCALAMPSLAQAAGSEDLFADGNRLFRDDLYWAALLRYEQAEAAGLDTPLLHYNQGVAHYRARQYGRARLAFQQAVRDPALALAANYNLGLTAAAAGDRRTALVLFRGVADQQSSPRLGELATRAIAALGAPARDSLTANEPGSDATTSERPRGFQLRVSLGVGSDDNAYRSPSQQYADRSEAGNPPVSPATSSGVFYPFDVNARYSVGSFENESFFGSYQVMGRYYQDPLLENAGELTHQLAFGSAYHRKAEDRERKIYSAFTVAQHNEVWYDPDDGSERTDNGELLGDRLSYVRYGPELRARQSFKRLSFRLDAKGQIWNYEQVAGTQEYDHEFLTAGVSVQYRFTSTSLLRIEGEIYQRRFGDRRAFSLDGTQSIDNPSLRYDYVSVGATARQRLTRGFWFGLRYARTERTDQYLGYYDYLRDSYGAEFSLRIGNRLKVRAEGWYRIYNYVRAYAFNAPAAGRKTMEAADARLTALWQLNDELSLIGSYEFDETASNDARIDYLRSQFMIGLRWQL